MKTPIRRGRIEITLVDELPPEDRVRNSAEKQLIVVEILCLAVQNRTQWVKSNMHYISMSTALKPMKLSHLFDVRQRSGMTYVKLKKKKCPKTSLRVLVPRAQKLIDTIARKKKSAEKKLSNET